MVIGEREAWEMALILEYRILELKILPFLNIPFKSTTPRGQGLSYSLGSSTESQTNTYQIW